MVKAVVNLDTLTLNIDIATKKEVFTYLEWL